MTWHCRSASRIAGDTSATPKKRQRADPPHILLSTPESLARSISYQDAPRMFAGLKPIIIDEIHALARLQSIYPNLRRDGLSATVQDPSTL